MSNWIDYVDDSWTLAEDGSELSVHAYNVDDGLFVDLAVSERYDGELLVNAMQLGVHEIQLLRDLFTSVLDRDAGADFPGKHVREPQCCAPFEHRPQGYSVCHVCGVLLREDEREGGRCEEDLFT